MDSRKSDERAPAPPTLSLAGGGHTRAASLLPRAPFCETTRLHSAFTQEIGYTGLSSQFFFLCRRIELIYGNLTKKSGLANPIQVSGA
jgi:hypothetical protein